MRRLVLVTVLLLVPMVPARAADTGQIAGVVRNGTTERVQPGAKVTLVHLEGDSEPEAKTATTDAKGRYGFGDLETGDEHTYFLDVNHQGGLFSSGQISVPDNTEQEPLIEVNPTVWDTTDDPTVIALRRNDLFLTPKDNSLAVIDSYRVFNISDRAYIGRGGMSANTSLAFPLPELARDNGVAVVSSPRIDIPELRATDFGFGITVAVPPGRTDMVFTYSVDGDGGSYDLTRTALYATLDSSVFAQEPLEVRSNRLVQASDEPRTIGEGEYIEYAAPDEIDAGDPLQILAVAEAGMSPWLIVGAGVMFGLIALALAIGIVLRRRHASKRKGATAPARDASAEREQIVVAIAELDLRYGNGDIGEEEWRVQREELKSRVDRRAPEPTP